MSKEFREKLNSLQLIKADDSWKESNRNVLLSQIDNTRESDNHQHLFNLRPFSMSRFFAPAYQPIIIAAFSLLVVVAGTTSLFASRNTKPGDSLYIAKKISEKTQYALTFNEKSKAALNIKFARNRAEELGRILDEGVNHDMPVDQEAVAKLRKDIKKEIVEVRSRVNSFVKEENVEVAVVLDEKEEESNNGSVFSANLSKEGEGYSLSENGDEDFMKENVVLEDTKDEKVEAVEPVEEKIATGTEDVEIVASSSEDNAVEEDAGDDADLEAFDEAGEFLESGEYAEVLSKLDEVSEGLDDDGEVKGISEVADNFLPEVSSSSDDLVEEE